MWRSLSPIHSRATTKRRYNIYMETRSIAVGIVIGGILFSGLSVAIAWTGPASAAPNGNVSAPINVGSTDQVKNAGLSVNALAVFGNAILSGTSRYLNFGTTAGSSGYGIRDNAGIIEVKDSNGLWARFATTSSNGTISRIRFSDGTTQTTAAAAAPGVRFGSTNTVSPGGWGTKSAQCPSGYVVIGVNMTTGGSGDYFSSILCQQIY
jgi:hypothetical protein